MNLTFLKKKLKEIAPVAISLVLCMILFSVITGTSCLFSATSGIPCPGCGLTRAFISAFQLNFAEAFYYHPLFWLVPIIVVLAIIKARNFDDDKFKWIDRFFQVCLIVAVVLYFVRMIMFFPHTAPMKFNKNMILLRAFDFIKFLFNKFIN